MKSKPRPRRCSCCKRLFTPDRRSAHRQAFCARLECRKASKAASQHKWQSKSENQDYWRGPEHVDRVRAWRKAHSQYWKRAAQEKKTALQDDFVPKDPLIVGIVAALAGSTLQDDIADTFRRLIAKGRAILIKQKTATP